MHRTTHCVLAGWLVVSMARSQDPAARTREYIASGDEFGRAGKYGEATIQYRNAI